MKLQTAAVPGGPNAVAEPKGMEKQKMSFRENPYAKPTTLKCFRCLQPGHKSNKCPTRHQLQLAEGEEKCNPAELQDDSEEGIEEIGADEGEPILDVIEKLLLAQLKSVETQRHSIFRTKCTIHDKVCDLVIDSGCTENIISKAVVQSL